MESKNGYEIGYDIAGWPPFIVKPTANAWWADPVRVTRFICLLERGLLITEACEQVQISLRQYKYFFKEHPKFSLVLDYLHELQKNRARWTLAERADADPKVAMKYLERKDPNFYKKKWVLVPYCQRCVREISVGDLTPGYKGPFEEMVTKQDKDSAKKGAGSPRKQGSEMKSKKETPSPPPSQGNGAEEDFNARFEAVKKRDEERRKAEIKRQEETFRIFEKRKNPPKNNWDL